MKIHTGCKKQCVVSRASFDYVTMICDSDSSKRERERERQESES